jgi:hypothetical protein
MKMVIIEFYGTDFLRKIDVISIINPYLTMHYSVIKIDPRAFVQPSSCLA